MNKCFGRFIAAWFVAWAILSIFWGIFAGLFHGFPDWAMFILEQIISVYVGLRFSRVIRFNHERNLSRRFFIIVAVFVAPWLVLAAASMGFLGDFSSVLPMWLIFTFAQIISIYVGLRFLHVIDFGKSDNSVKA